MKLFMEVIILRVCFSHHKLVGVALKLIDDWAQVNSFMKSINPPSHVNLNSEN